MAMTHYTIAIDRPSTHMMNVRATLSGRRGLLRLAMPVWTPGSYMVREYSQFVQDVKVSAPDGTPVSWYQEDKRTWVVDTSGQERIHFDYRLYANQLTVRTNHVDDTHAFICGAATFVEVEGEKESPSTVSLEMPEGWEVTTPLLQNEDGQYQANDFDHLVDSPIEVGIQRTIHFEALGKPHRYVFWGEGNWNEEALIRDTIAVVEETARHYGGELPYEEYIFIVHSAKGIRGGLEHLNSTVLAWDCLSFWPLSNHEEFMRLVAHEFYHTWNVKRTRARILGPFDYSKENHTKMLWLHEGGTVYYEGLIPMRSGILRTTSWLKEMGKSVHTLRSWPGRKHLSVGASSFNAWTKLYRRNEHSQNSMISYYLKGELVCFCLDKWIRETTDEEKTLDDVMRLFFERSGPPNAGFLDEDVAPWIEEVAGASPDAFLAAYVDGLEPLPLEETFSWYGLDLKGKHDDLGEHGEGASLGIKSSASAGRARVTFVHEEGPASAAGLQAFDEIIAMDGLKVSNTDLVERLKDCTPGQVVELAFFRRDRLRHLSIELGPRPFDSYEVRPKDDATAQEKQRFEKLLGVSFPDEAEG